MSNLKLVKLVNSELLIGDLEETVDEFLLKKSIQLLIFQGQDGSPQLALVDMNSNIGNTEVLRLSKNSLLYTFDPNDEIIRAYQEKISGLIIPKAGSHVPKLDLSSLSN